MAAYFKYAIILFFLYNFLLPPGFRQVDDFIRYKKGSSNMISFEKVQARECLNFFLIDVIEIYSLVLVKVYTLPSVAKQSVGVIFTGVKIMVS